MKLALISTVIASLASPWFYGGYLLGYNYLLVIITFLISPIVFYKYPCNYDFGLVVSILLFTFYLCISFFNEFGKFEDFGKYIVYQDYVNYLPSSLGGFFKYLKIIQFISVFLFAHILFYCHQFPKKTILQLISLAILLNLGFNFYGIVNYCFNLSPNFQLLQHAESNFSSGYFSLYKYGGNAGCFNLIYLLFNCNIIGITRKNKILPRLTFIAYLDLLVIVISICIIGSRITYFLTVLFPCIYFLISKEYFNKYKIISSAIVVLLCIVFIENSYLKTQKRSVARIQEETLKYNVTITNPPQDKIVFSLTDEPKLSKSKIRINFVLTKSSFICIKRWSGKKLVSSINIDKIPNKNNLIVNVSKNSISFNDIFYELKHNSNLFFIERANNVNLINEELSFSGRVKRIYKDLSYNSRFQLYNTTINFIREKPLFGYGFGSWHILYLLNKPVGQVWQHWAHSDPLQLIAEIGLFGCSLFLFILTRIYILFIRSFPIKVTKELLTPTIFYFLFSLFDYPMHVMSLWLHFVFTSIFICYFKSKFSNTNYEPK